MNSEIINKAKSLFNREISELVIPKEKVITIKSEWSLQRALLILTRKGTNSVPVINNNRQVEGLISKTNILDYTLKRSKNESMNFSDLQNHMVIEAIDANYFGILPNSIFSFAFESLIDRSYIPIIDIRNQFLGILTRKVMMEKVIEYFHKEYISSVEQKH